MASVKSSGVFQEINSELLDMVVYVNTVWNKNFKCYISETYFDDIGIFLYHSKKAGGKEIGILFTNKYGEIHNDLGSAVRYYGFNNDLVYEEYYWKNEKITKKAWTKISKNHLKCSVIE